VYLEAPPSPRWGQIPLTTECGGGGEGSVPLRLRGRGRWAKRTGWGGRWAKRTGWGGRWAKRTGGGGRL